MTNFFTLPRELRQHILFDCFDEADRYTIQVCTQCHKIDLEIRFVIQLKWQDLHPQLSNLTAVEIADEYTNAISTPHAPAVSSMLGNLVNAVKATKYNQLFVRDLTYVVNEWADTKRVPKDKPSDNADAEWRGRNEARHIAESRGN